MERESLSKEELVRVSEIIGGIADSFRNLKGVNGVIRAQNNGFADGLVKASEFLRDFAGNDKTIEQFKLDVEKNKSNTVVINRQ